MTPSSWEQYSWVKILITKCSLVQFWNTKYSCYKESKPPILLPLLRSPLKTESQRRRERHRPPQRQSPTDTCIRSSPKEDGTTVTTTTWRISHWFREHPQGQPFLIRFLWVYRCEDDTRWVVFPVSVSFLTFNLIWETIPSPSKDLLLRPTFLYTEGRNLLCWRYVVRPLRPRTTSFHSSTVYLDLDLWMVWQFVFLLVCKT